METPSEENQDLRQDKRGTNERSQRASSVLFTAVFIGALTYSSLLGLTLRSSLVDSAQQRFFLNKAQHPCFNICMHIIVDIPVAECASLPLQNCHLCHPSIVFFFPSSVLLMLV